MVATSKLPEHAIFTRAFLAYSQKDAAVSTVDDFEMAYGPEAVTLVTNHFSSIVANGTPEREIERMLVHAMIVTPLVLSFAPECLASKQHTSRELEELSDYLYSHFSYDPASDRDQEYSEPDLLRGAVIEYYVGTSTDATIEHLRWIGSRMCDVLGMSTVLTERQSIDRGLIESLASAASKPLMNGML